MAAMHGHIHHLHGKADFIFFPFYLDHHPSRDQNRRQYCYYTQYAPSLAAFIKGPDDVEMGGTAGVRSDHCLLSPLVNYLYGRFHARVQLYKMLKSMSPRKITFSEVSHAYETARQFKKETSGRLKQLYATETHFPGELHVVLLGRPYTVSGAVERGAGRGRHLGYPTINITIPTQTLPQTGVYVARVTWEEGSAHGMSYLGRRLTYQEENLTFEVNLFDFKGDLYGKPVTVEFLHYIREEEHFATEDDLREQLKKDEEESRKYLER